MLLTTSLVSKPAAQADVDILVLPITKIAQLQKVLPSRAAQALTSEVKRRRFEVKPGRALLARSIKGVRAPFVAVVGLGLPMSMGIDQAESLRRGLGHVVNDARRHGLRHIGVCLAHLDEAGPLAAATLEGAELANYRFSEYSERLRREQAQIATKKMTLLISQAQRKIVAESLSQTRVVLRGVLDARNLVNQPAENMVPAALVAYARQLAKGSKQIRLKVLDRAQARQAGFTAFLAVAQGSPQEPYVIHLTYKPPRTVNAKKLFLVGKGVTFDSGGLSIKPADFMESMKIDMAGAATVLGLFGTLDALNPDVEVHGVIAACENMPSGSAYRPGDVLTAKNGKTIEVLNTDAEGRITLADSLAYAAEHAPDAIIDIATLTGACMVALGETVAGLFSNDKGLQNKIVAAGTAVGESVAILPMPEEYRPFIESQIADIRNTSTSHYGGAITAAMFLREFIGTHAWAHLDIAGPSYAERVTLPYQPMGATGFGVRLLAHVVQNFSKIDATAD